MRLTTMRLTTLAAALSVLLAATSAAAQAPSAREIVERLTPAPASRSLTRGFDRGITLENVPARPTTPPSIDLQVNFEYASAKLTTDALLVLDNLGRALNDPALKDSRFRIAGHTDAAGGDAYNQRLSEERAWTVCSYLTLRHHVAAQRLSAAGYGRSQPIDPADPNAAVNRRVEITNIGQN